ncbi:PorT family protein [Segetibacter sp. 3557_3]|uniref:outer membrane beta-barrel protein n=1 Tax=Segetibacter sp. 3557_3 TaxID=2547429 RepID=UPI0010585847|nr:outer membrane beta-barrel protein [Segetibacter sp. 3557_3]TDH20694.1 PorT family protein [Segetibacter sp. 3557_3]
MKKIVLAALIILSCQSIHAQVTDTTKVIISSPNNVTTSSPANATKIDLSSRSNDHFMVQYGLDRWSGNPDSTAPKGFSRHFNAYVMLDKPFKNNPRFSVGLGVGISSSNMFFERRNVDVKSTSARLPFQNLDSANHFKKYKLTTVYAEAPIELRYSTHPEDDNKSFKLAAGVKIGTLLNAHTKGKTLEDKNGTSLNNYIAKESSKKFFNSTRLSVTGRIGYGIVSLHGAYTVTGILKDGVGPVIRPYSIGLAISGL